MIHIIKSHIIPAAFSILPDKMDKLESKPMLIAIALQESKLKHRRQMNGPARSFWQFEEGDARHRSGIAGVRIHENTYAHFRDILRLLQYKDTVSNFEIHRIIEHNDILACAIARLLLYTLPMPLPKRGDFDGSWAQYIAAWNPGKPHRETWNAYYSAAWREYDNSDTNSIRLPNNGEIEPPSK